MTISTKNRIKRIYEALPKMDCGHCGFDSCAKFARAVAERKTSPFGCRRDPGVGYAISGILRESIPEGDDILYRIENLEVGRQ